MTFYEKLAYEGLYERIKTRNLILTTFYIPENFTWKILILND